MADTFTMKIVNERAFKAAIKRKVTAFGDMRPAISKALDYMERSIKQKTEKQQNETITAGSRPFRPLSPKYAATKRKKWGFKPILIASGKMIKGNWYRKILKPLQGILEYSAPTKQKIIAMSHQNPKKFPKRRRRWFGFRGGDRRAVSIILRAGLRKALRA